MIPAFGTLPVYQRESSPHVASVTVTSGSTAEQKWSYSYNADDLSTMCAPSQTAPLTPDTSCTVYSYQQGSVYRQAVLDSGPYQYWPLADVGETGSSNSSPSLVGADVGSGSASYQNLTADTSSSANPATRIGSTASSALFNGSSGFVYLPPGMVTNTTYVSVGLWFKTTGSGPLFCEQSFAITASSGNATCSLYVGTDGLLRGEWYQGARSPITSSSVVNDGAWHYALLSGEGDTQSLYLDGQLVGSLPDTITNLAQSLRLRRRGLLLGCVAEHGGRGRLVLQRFDRGSRGLQAGRARGRGRLALPVRDRPGCRDHRDLPARRTRRMRRPADEKPAATVAYDTVSGRVQSVTDSNGATWTLGAPN